MDLGRKDLGLMDPDKIRNEQDHTDKTECLVFSLMPSSPSSIRPSSIRPPL